MDSTITIAENTALTTSKDILESVAIGVGPEKMLLTLGYAGWTPGQLEQEIAANSWLTVQAKDVETLHKILYDTADDDKLNVTLALLGVDPAMLSDVAGHA
jgi:putative transcriptional regulator